MASSLHRQILGPKVLKCTICSLLLNGNLPPPPFLRCDVPPQAMALHRLHWLSWAELFFRLQCLDDSR